MADSRRFPEDKKLGLGCVELGRCGRAGLNLVREALDLGVTVFDTADAYGSGTSERLLGKALRGRRDQAFIATKVGYRFRERSAVAAAARRPARPLVRALRNSPGGGTARFGAADAYRDQDFAPAYLRSAVEASLRRLGTDYVDLVQLHGPKAVHADALALMVDLRAEGKIGGVGVGLESLDGAESWLATGALNSIQVPFGVLDPEAGEQLIPRAASEGIAVMARGIFAAGLLARPGRSADEPLGGQSARTVVRIAALRALAEDRHVTPMELAAWFVAARPGISTILVGTSSAPHLRQSVAYLRSPAPDWVSSEVERLTSVWARSR